jgi:biopolymer transport protein ExbB
VIGLIQVFDDLGVHQGPIEPSMLAGGLGIAMKTTAAGLIIALPAVLGAHGFQLWVERLIHQTEHAMNMHNLELEGICTKAIQ